MTDRDVEILLRAYEGPQPRPETKRAVVRRPRLQPNKERKKDFTMKPSSVCPARIATHSLSGKVQRLLKRTNHGVLDVAAILVIAVMLGLLAQNYLQQSAVSPR